MYYMRILSKQTSNLLKFNKKSLQTLREKKQKKINIFRSIYPNLGNIQRLESIISKLYYIE